MPRIYRHCSFVTISEDTHDQMTAGRFSKRPIGIVHGGVDPSLVPGAKSPQPTVLYLGRLMPYKRVERIIAAFVNVRQRIPDAVLRIAGTGPARESLEALAAASGIADAVLFEGFVSDERKRELLQSAWVYCTASEMEGWGLSVIEANACGTPAVAHAAPGLREAIADGESGLLVPENEDLSAALERVLNDAKLRGNLERGAIVRASEFSWDASARTMMEAVMHAAIGDWFGLVRLENRWTLVRRAETKPLERALVTDHVLIDATRSVR